MASIGFWSQSLHGMEIWIRWIWPEEPVCTWSIKCLLVFVSMPLGFSFRVVPLFPRELKGFLVFKVLLVPYFCYRSIWEETTTVCASKWSRETTLHLGLLFIVYLVWCFSIKSRKRGFRFLLKRKKQRLRWLFLFLFWNQDFVVLLEEGFRSSWIYVCFLFFILFLFLLLFL